MASKKKSGLSQRPIPVKQGQLAKKLREYNKALRSFGGRKS